MTCSRICVAVALQRYLDITPVAERLREFAAVLARAHGAAVNVLSVEAPVALLPDVETLSEKLDRFVAPLRETGISLQADIRKGRPSKEIATYVKEVGADLLVIGSHSKRSVLDVGIGSTASALMRDLDVSLVMVCPTAAEHAEAEKLMIPRYPMVFPYG